MVIKDRNPIGIFKKVASAKGVVTIIITNDGIFQWKILQDFFGKRLWDQDIRKAFISHLDINVEYSLSIMVRKGKHNVSILRCHGCFTRDCINKKFDKFLEELRIYIGKFINKDVKKYGDKSTYIDFVQFIFRPLVVNRNSSLCSDDSNLLKDREEETSEKRSE